MRKALLVCTTFVAVAAALAGVLLAYTQTDAFRAWLRGKIWAALDESIDREFSLGELRGNPVTGVVLEDFRIALWDSLRGGELLSAAQVKARYNLLDLLRGRLLVRSLVLESPSIQLERTGDGIWNSASLLARREGGVERPYRIQVPSVRVHDLRLVIVQPSRTDSLVAEGISGALDIANHEGRIHGTANGLRVGPIGLDVTALLTDVAYDRERVSINSLTLDGRRIRLRLEGTFFPGPGKLDFTLAESSLESESLWSLLAPGQKPRLSGTVKFAGRLRGSVKAPDLEGSLQMLQGSLDARSLENLRARISYRDRELSVSGLDGRVCGSRMTGFLKASSFPPSGAKPAQILGRIEVRDLDITRLSSSVPPHLRSRITGSVVLRGGARDDGRFRIHVGLSLTSGVVDRYRFDSLAALAVISQEGAEISDFRLTQGNAFVSAHGEVYPGGLSLNVESSEIDLEEVAGMAGLTGVSGRLHLQGLVTGKPSDPGLVGALWIRDGSIRGARFAYLEGSVSARNLRTGFRGEATVTAWGARFLGGEGLNRMECRVISEETGRNRFVLSGQRDSSTWLEVEGTWSPGPDSQAVNVERIAGLWRGGGSGTRARCT
jgi:autotransporter translocation and assembly factor TamB